MLNIPALIRMRRLKTNEFYDNHEQVINDSLFSYEIVHEFPVIARGEIYINGIYKFYYHNPNSSYVIGYAYALHIDHFETTIIIDHDDVDRSKRLAREYIFKALEYVNHE